MDVGGIRNLLSRLSSRSTRLGVTACLLLVGLVIVTVWQFRMVREALDRAAAAEQSASQARTDAAQTRSQLQGKPLRDPSVRRSRHDDPREIERVQRLYAEIQGLSQFQETVEQKLGGGANAPTGKAPAGAGPTRPGKDGRPDARSE